MFKVWPFSKQETSIVPPMFQMVFIVINLFAISSLYLTRLGKFRSIDTIEHPIPLDSAILAVFPSEVKVGLSVIKYERFDVIKNNFIFDGYIWFLLSPGAVPLTALSQFSFSRGELLQRSTPFIKLIGDKILVQYEIRLSFAALLSYTYFPLDEHKISITVSNKQLSPQQAIFISEDRNFVVQASAKEFGWDNVNTTVETGYQSLKLDPYDPQKNYAYPQASFTIDYKRDSWRYLMSLVLPLLFIFYLSLFSLSMSGSSQITVAVAALTGTITYRFVFDTLSPNVGYFMLSDYLFLSFLSAVFITFLLALIDSFGLKLPLRFKKVAIGWLHTMIIALSAYLTS